MGEMLTGYVRKLEQRQQIRHRMARLHATLYADMPVRGLGPFAYTQVDAEPDSARLNAIKAVTDTWVAAIVKNIPDVTTLTRKGDWALKRRAEGLNMWLEATSEEQGIASDLTPFVYRGAGVFGTCFAKVYEDVPGGINGAHWDEAKVGIDVAFQHEITVDEAEAQNPRNLRSIFHSKWYDVDVLCDMFPDKKSEILDAPRGADGYGSATSGWDDDATNQILVTEGWHLRSSRTANDGRRAIALPNVTLARVPYELDRFPFAAARRAKAPMGLWGIGIPQELKGIQTSINEIMLSYEEAMIFFARPKWMIPRGAGVERAHLDDRIGTQIEFDGPVAPVMYVPNVVMPGDVMQMLQLLWAKAFEQPGVNQLLASGQVPAGLKSGDAIDTYNDTGAARGIESMKLSEQFQVDLAMLRIESARVIAKHNPKFASEFVGKRATELVYFKDVDPDRDRFRLSAHAISSLPASVEGKLDRLDRMFDRGLIDMQTYRVLLDFPDLEKESSRANAPYEVVDCILSAIYEADDPSEVALSARNAPDPNWPLEWMRARVQFAAAEAFVDNAPDNVLDAVNQYIDLLDAALKSAKAGAMPPPAPPPAPMPPMGPAAPAPPPAMGAGPPPPNQLAA